jgi:predicted transcriptional regulator
MVNKILLPQEVETFYIIPSLRKHFSIYMKGLGMKQKDIAELLMVNTAAISQYQSEKRGNQVTFTPEIKDEIKISAHKIKDTITYMQETQRILRLIRTSKFLCQIHKQFSAVPEACNPEIVGCTESLARCN